MVSRFYFQSNSFTYVKVEQVRELGYLFHSIFYHFFLLGVWHGRTWPFLLCGTMFAFGAIIVILFKEIKQRNNGRFKLSSKHLIYFLKQTSRALTYYYISLVLWAFGCLVFCYLITGHLILKAQ